MNNYADYVGNNDQRMLGHRALVSKTWFQILLNIIKMSGIFYSGVRFSNSLAEYGSHRLKFLKHEKIKNRCTRYGNKSTMLQTG